MLLHEFYPNDIRVTKEVSSLIAAGFELHLICLQRKKEDNEEIVNGIHVHRIPIAQSFFWRGIWDILLAVNFFQPRFYKKLKMLNAVHHFDALHVHDLPLSKTALRFRDKEKGPPVVLDFHENYPEALKVWFVWKKNPLIRLKNKLFFSFNRWLSYERSVSKAADLIIVVVSEMKDRVTQLHGLASRKIVVVTNSETRDFLNQKQIPEIYTRDEGDFILSYTGGVGPHRGVDVCIEGLKHLKAYPKIKLEITGSLSADSKQWLETLAKENGVSDKVKINGYQPFEKFFSYMKYAEVNLIPHNRNGHTDHTIPHKLYQGMLTGKPVVVSSAPPLERLVNEHNSGLVFEAGNPEDFAKKIASLYTNPALYQQLGANGYHATFHETANWESTGKVLVKAYSLLTKDSV